MLKFEKLIAALDLISVWMLTKCTFRTYRFISLLLSLTRCLCWLIGTYSSDTPVERLLVCQLKGRCHQCPMHALQSWVVDLACGGHILMSFPLCACVCVCVCRFLGKKQTNALRMVLLNGLLWKCFRRMLYIWCRVHCHCVCVDSDGDHFGLVHLGWNCYYSILCGVRCTRTARSSYFDGGGHRIRANVIIFV